MSTRVLTVVGARPQFIKAAPVERAFSAANDFESLLVHTGQHFDENMSAVFFEELSIPRPQMNLGINSGPHGQLTGRMLEALEAVMLEEEPDWVLVFGDTDSTLAAALAAAKLRIRLAHLEAGLRSFNRSMPEEINRVLTDHCSDLLLTPTDTADRNLAAEGISGKRVVRTGDVMFDAVRHFGRLADQEPGIVGKLGLEDEGYVLATVHRAENTDDPGRLMAIVQGLNEIAVDIPVVLPLHPRTRKAIARSGVSFDAVSVISPVGYLDMIRLERGCRLAVTDSGGVQKEAFFQGRPCVTLRTETEWTELVETGWNHLVPPVDGRDVAAGIRAALDAGLGRSTSPYGDGQAASHVLDALRRR